MVKKADKAHPETAGDGRKAAAHIADTVKESAQQIWLAGLGAFAKAQEEGGRVFESLVKEGATLQRKTQASAGDRFAEATTRMASVATELTARATGQLDKLEGIFEERVARALKRLGVPNATELQALAARMDALERALAKGNALAAKRVARKVPRKRSPARKAA